MKTIYLVAVIANFQHNIFKINNKNIKIEHVVFTQGFFHPSSPFLHSCDRI